MSGRIWIQGQVWWLAHTAVFLGMGEDLSAPERKQFWSLGTVIPGGFDIWSQGGERKASSPHVIHFHQRLIEANCSRKLKSKQTKNYQGNKPQEMEDKGEKCSEKHFLLLTSLSYVQRACEKYWTCDSRNIPKRAVCGGSTINNKALWNFWRFSTKAWSSLLRRRISFNYCTLGYSFKMLLQWKFLSLREGNTALSYHFPSLLQASAHSECVWGQADPPCLLFQVLFFFPFH